MAPIAQRFSSHDNNNGNAVDGDGATDLLLPGGGDQIQDSRSGYSRGWLRPVLRPPEEPAVTATPAPWYNYRTTAQRRPPPPPAAAAGHHGDKNQPQA
jgi:hypothetical protein